MCVLLFPHYLTLDIAFYLMVSDITLDIVVTLPLVHFFLWLQFFPIVPRQTSPTHLNHLLPRQLIITPSFGLSSIVCIYFIMDCNIGSLHLHYYSSVFYLLHCIFYCYPHLVVICCCVFCLWFMAVACKRLLLPRFPCWIIVRT